MLKRAACLATIFFGSIAWPCMPAPFEAFTAKGNTTRRLTVEVGERSSELKQAGETVWKLPVTAFSVLFADDDTWVAFSPGLGETKIRIAGTAVKAQVSEVDVVSRLTQDERTFLTFSSCGTQWFAGWKSSPKGLRVFVTQKGQARPTQAEAAGIEFLIAPDGTVTRVTAALEVDLLKLAEAWTGPASPARAEIAASISQLSATQTGRAQAAKLGPYLKRVFATADSAADELEGAARLVGLLPGAEAKNLIAVVLGRPGFEAPLLWGLPQGELRDSLAARVFADSSRSARARSTAVRVGTSDGANGYGPMLKAALNDPDPDVRGTAADNVQRAKCTCPMLNDVLVVLAKEISKPTTAPADKFAHGRLVGNYQGAVSRCMRDATDATRHAMVAAAIEGGLRFEPAEYVTPLIYTELLPWAELAAPASVETLLALAEESCGAQKYEGGKAPLSRVVQWRVLRAIKANDLKEARAQLELLRRKDSNGRVPALQPEDLGVDWKVADREERTSEFIARIQPRIDPKKPAASSRSSQP